VVTCALRLRWLAGHGVVVNKEGIRREVEGIADPEEIGDREAGAEGEASAWFLFARPHSSSHVLPMVASSRLGMTGVSPS